MSRQLSFPFEELPLIIDLGFQAGLVNGSALIDYWTDGQWGIAQVYLNGHRRKLAAADILAKIPGAKLWDERDVLLERGCPIALKIIDRLEHDWRGRVQDAVNHALDEERVSHLEGV